MRKIRGPGLPSMPPDFDEPMKRVVAAVAEYTLTSPERVGSLVNATRYIVANGIAGDVVECGVWRGGSAMAVAMTLRELGDSSRRLYLYDTYEGMNAPTEHDVAFDGTSAAGTFAAQRLSDDSSEWCRSPIGEVETNLVSTGYPRDKLSFIK